MHMHGDQNFFHYQTSWRALQAAIIGRNAVDQRANVPLANSMVYATHNVCPRDIQKPP